MSRFQEDVERHLLRVRDALEHEHAVNLVSFVVFGSVARGEARPGSDVDLLLVFRHLPRGRQARFRIFYQALEHVRTETGPLTAAGQPFDWSPVILSFDEAGYHSPLYLDMVEDARMLLDRGGFFAGVLADLRERMRALGSRRVRLPDGTWYWDLKPDWRPGEVIEL